MADKVYVQWEEVEAFIGKVKASYQGKGITGVYGFPRGGLVLAVMLSHRMGIPLLAAPCKNCIIIDDICDSGETLLHYDRNSSGEDKKAYHIVTMFYKQNSLGVKPELYDKEKDDAWVVFPWEKED